MRTKIKYMLQPQVQEKVSDKVIGFSFVSGCKGGTSFLNQSPSEHSNSNQSMPDYLFLTLNIENCSI